MDAGVHPQPAPPPEGLGAAQLPRCERAEREHRAVRLARPRTGVDHRNGRGEASRGPEGAEARDRARVRDLPVVAADATGVLLPVAPGPDTPLGLRVREPPRPPPPGVLRTRARAAPALVRGVGSRRPSRATLASCREAP